MLAQHFNTSKDVMKYHRKHLPTSEIRKDEQGVIWISERGKALIQEKLRKKTYSASFENEVLQNLRRIEKLLEVLLSHSLESSSKN